LCSARRGAWARQRAVCRSATAHLWHERRLGKPDSRKRDATQLANALSNFLNRTVLDQTGVTGNFDVDLTWTPDQMPQLSDVPPIDPNGPSIFTAIQEQLGLKLESAKGPVDVLVIDHVEHPTEN
jgi:uncharacterized protein (TIGR03435 family)